MRVNLGVESGDGVNEGFKVVMGEMREFKVMVA